MPMYQKALDDFNRANENPLSGSNNWGHLVPTVSPFKLQGNTVIPTVDGVANLAFFTNYPFGNNQYSEFLLPSDPNPAGVAIRIQDTKCYIARGRRQPGVKYGQIFKLTYPPIVFTAIGVNYGASLADAAGMFRFEAIGNALNVYDAGNLIYTINDGSIASGYPGLYGDYIASPVFDAWRGGDDSPDTSSPLVTIPITVQGDTINKSNYYWSGTLVTLNFPSKTLFLRIESHDQNAQGMHYLVNPQQVSYTILTPGSIQISFLASYRTLNASWGLGLRFNYNGIDYSDTVDFINPNGRLYYRSHLYTIIINTPIWELGLPHAALPPKHHIGRKYNLRYRT